jgi:surfeit locus 1 family protein
MAWKRVVLADIAAAEVRPAVEWSGTPAPYTKVRVSGRLRLDRAVLYGAEGRDVAGRPVMGAQLLVPLERAGAPVLLVLMGWVAGLPGQAVAVEATIEGYVRPGETAGMFAASDDATGRRFYTLDPARIGAALGMAPMAGDILVALGPPAVPPAPDPAHRLPRPTDNHLAYAVTWFGLALGLVGVFLVYARKVLRS